MTCWPSRSDQKRCYGQAEEEDGDYEPVDSASRSDTGKMDVTYCTPARTGLARYIRASLMIMKYKTPAQELMTTKYVTNIDQPTSLEGQDIYSIMGRYLQIVSFAVLPWS